MARSSVCALVSGGLDSAVMLAVLAWRFRNIYPVYIRQGLRWETAELFWLRRFLSKKAVPGVGPLTVLSLPVQDLYPRSHWAVGRGRVPGARSRDEAVYLPGRNILLTAKAAVFCAQHKIGTLALGTLASNPFPDASRAFLRSLERAYSVGLSKWGHTPISASNRCVSPIKIIQPLSGYHKKDLVRIGRGLPLHLTFSCIAPVGRRPCGHCNKCAERRQAFRTA